MSLQRSRTQSLLQERKTETAPPGLLQTSAEEEYEAERRGVGGQPCSASASDQSIGDPVTCSTRLMTVYSNAGRPSAYAHQRTGKRQRQTGLIQSRSDPPVMVITAAPATIGPRPPMRNGTRPPPIAASNHRVQENAYASPTKVANWWRCTQG